MRRIVCRNILEHAPHPLCRRSDKLSGDSDISQCYVVFPIHTLNLGLPDQVHAEVSTHCEIPLEGEHLLLICHQADIVNRGPVVVGSALRISDLELDLLRWI